MEYLFGNAFVTRIVEVRAGDLDLIDFTELPDISQQLSGHCGFLGWRMMEMKRSGDEGLDATSWSPELCFAD